MGATTTRWMAASVLALAAVGGVGAWVAADDEHEVFCTAEGFLTVDGVIGRSGDRCLLTDQDGDVVMAFPNGDPLCYGWIIGQESRATEGGDQVFPCDDSPPGVGNAYRPG